MRSSNQSKCAAGRSSFSFRRSDSRSFGEVPQIGIGTHPQQEEEICMGGQSAASPGLRGLSRFAGTSPTILRGACCFGLGWSRMGWDWGGGRVLSSGPPSSLLSPLLHLPPEPCERRFHRKPQISDILLQIYMHSLCYGTIRHLPVPFYDCCVCNCS